MRARASCQRVCAQVCPSTGLPCECSSAPCARPAANGSASPAEHGGGGACNGTAANGHSPAAQGGERGGGGAHPAAAGGGAAPGGKGGGGGVKWAYANGSADPRDHGAAHRARVSSAADAPEGDGAAGAERDGAADAGARGGGGSAELVISSSADKLALGGGAGYARPSAEPLFPAALRGRAHAPLCLPGAAATWHRRGQGLCIRVAVRLPGALDSRHARSGAFRLEVWQRLAAASWARTPVRLVTRSVAPLFKCVQTRPPSQSG